MSPKRKQVVRRAAKAHRAMDRKRAGPLRRNLVAAKTEIRYLHSVVAFLWYICFSGLPLADSYEMLDSQLCLFVEHLYETGEGKSFANDLLSGTQHFLLISRHHLHASWRLMGVWKKLEVCERAPPLPEICMLALAGVAVSQQRWNFAAAVLTSFHCLLRPIEVVTLCGSQVLIGPDGRGVVSLPGTKSGQRKHATESVTIENRLVARALHAALERKLPHEMLIGDSCNSFRLWFYEAMKILQLESFAFKPYSLRRGGATEHFSRVKSMALTMERGRWASARTARVYIEEGRAKIAEIRISQNASPSLYHFASLLQCF
jgi:hypothetical protein